jgi:outer membrane cobalamin receptor
MRTMIMVNGQPISPFSPLYGGDAVGGIINIITKTPETLSGRPLLLLGIGSDPADACCN